MRDVVVAPVGFVSDHMEVLYDLDTEAQEKAQALGLRLVRAATAGTHPAFVRMIRELVVERMTEGSARHDGGWARAPARCLPSRLLPGSPAPRRP